jgi:hypothetical protein
MVWKEAKRTLPVSQRDFKIMCVFGFVYHRLCQEVPLSRCFANDAKSCRNLGRQGTDAATGKACPAKGTQRLSVSSVSGIDTIHDPHAGRLGAVVDCHRQLKKVELAHLAQRWWTGIVCHRKRGVWWEVLSLQGLRDGMSFSVGHYS